MLYYVLCVSPVLLCGRVVLATAIGSHLQEPHWARARRVHPYPAHARSQTHVRLSPIDTSHCTALFSNFIIICLLSISAGPTRNIPARALQVLLSFKLALFVHRYRNINGTAPACASVCTACVHASFSLCFCSVWSCSTAVIRLSSFN